MKSRFKKEGISKKERISKKSEFNLIFKNGKKITSKELKTYFIKNNKKQSSFSIVIGKKLGNAIQRNRIKRLIREVYRKNKEYFGIGINWVFIPKGKWEKIDYYHAERIILDVVKGIRKKKI